MNKPQRPNGPREERGPLSWATAVNDSTVEWLAAFSRISCVVWALVAAITLMFLAVEPRMGTAVAATLAAVYAALSGWLGFIQLGNHEWKDAPNDDA